MSDAVPLTDDDRAHLQAIMDATDPLQIVMLLHAYYQDADRAERTSRSQMYLHLGLLSGLVLRVLEPPQ